MTDRPHRRYVGDQDPETAAFRLMHAVFGGMAGRRGRLLANVSALSIGALAGVAISRAGDWPAPAAYATIAFIASDLGGILVHGRHPSPRAYWAYTALLGVSGAVAATLAWQMAGLLMSIVLTVAVMLRTWNFAVHSTGATILAPVVRRWDNPCHAGQPITVTARGHDYVLDPRTDPAVPARDGAALAIHLVACNACNKVIAKDEASWFKLLVDGFMARNPERAARMAP
jgi:hypothetical protein